MAGKFGSPSAWLFVDGYDMRVTQSKGAGYKHEAIQEDTTGIGDSTEKMTPTGVSKVTLTQLQAFWDTDAFKTHQAMNQVPTSPQATARIVCLGFSGQTVGEHFTGIEGAYSQWYEVLGDNGKLTKANATYVVSGRIDHGVILQELESFTQDFTGDTVDGSAQSLNGGAGYLQLTAGFGSAAVKIQHSQNGVTWIDLITFTTASAPSAQRSTVTGTVYRYLRVSGTTFGDISASASISPSSSISPSASTSISPSSSLSPSASTSLSPSSSLSPSASTSLSPSSSRSPSTSLSPSVSASASVSPSAGLAGTITAFVGFARFAAS